MLRISRLTYMIGHYCRPCFVATNLSAIANCCLAFEAEILRVTILLGNGPLLDQSGLDLGSPQSSGGLFSNGQAGDVNGWSPFQSEVRMLTINIIFFFLSDLLFLISRIVLDAVLTFLVDAISVYVIWP